MTEREKERAAVKAIAIVHFDEGGEISYHVASDERFRLFIVDERAPHDRVYEWLPRCSGADIREIIPEGSEIGSSADDRHEAIKALIEARMEGRTHLALAGDHMKGTGDE